MSHLFRPQEYSRAFSLGRFKGMHENAQNKSFLFRVRRHVVINVTKLGGNESMIGCIQLRAPSGYRCDTWVSVLVV